VKFGTTIASPRPERPIVQQSSSFSDKNIGEGREDESSDHFQELAEYIGGIGCEWGEVRMATFVKARWGAAFDASGKEDLRCIVVAGFVSSMKDWKSFHVEWLKRLASDGLQFFHMNKFAVSAPPFDGLKGDKPRRDRLIGDLLGIIQSHAYRSFACTVEFADFYKLSEANQNEFSLNAYSLCGRTCVKHISDWRRREGLLKVPVGYAFEEGDKGAGLLSERMWKDGYPRPHFLPKKDRSDKHGSPVAGFTPLQAADILAYELYRLYSDMKFSQTPRFTTPDTHRWPMQQFDKFPGSNEWGLYEPRDLGNLDQKLADLSDSDVPPPKTDDEENPASSGGGGGRGSNLAPVFGS